MKKFVINESCSAFFYEILNERYSTPINI